MTAVQTLTYPLQALLGDYVRAGIGVAVTVAPLFIVPSDSYAVWVLGALALLFLAFAARTAWRHASRVEFDDERISLFGPGRVSFPWDALAAVKLSYYATTSDRQGGWMQLTLRGAGGGTIRIDSTIDGFADVARRAARAAHESGLGLSAATTSNFQAMGIAVDLSGDTMAPAAAFNRTQR